MVQEKRRLQRYEFQKNVRLYPVQSSRSGHILEVQDKPVDSWANDISPNGMRLEGDHAFEPNALVKMDFEIEGERKVEAFGKIVWTFDHHAGVSFILRDNRTLERIKAFCRKRDNNVPFDEPENPAEPVERPDMTGLGHEYRG